MLSIVCKFVTGPESGPGSRVQHIFAVGGAHSYARIPNEIPSGDNAQHCRIDVKEREKANVCVLTFSVRNESELDVSLTHTHTRTHYFPRDSFSLCLSVTLQCMTHTH